VGGGTHRDASVCALFQEKYNVKKMHNGDEAERAPM